MNVQYCAKTVELEGVGKM